MTEVVTRPCIVPTAQLRRACESFERSFMRSDELPAGTPHLGQQRAIDAIRFGIEVERPGYNVYVLGPLGSHRHGLVRELVDERASRKGPPEDWCYVNNFSDPERPRALAFPAGQGREFRDDMHALIEDMRVAIPAAFESDDYRNQMRAIEEETEKEVEAQWKSLEAEAAREGIGVLQTPTGYVLAPIREGKVIDDKEFEKLPKKEQRQIQVHIKRLSEALQARIESMPRLQKLHRERVKALDQRIIAHAVTVLLDELKQKYKTLDKVTAYLDEAQQNIIDNAQDFQQPKTSPLPFLSRDSSQLFTQYEVNLLTHNGEGQGAPVVYEPNPNYPNIIGKIEHRAEMGALVTDFRMIRSGALLQANGGYLVLDIYRVLSRPFVWDALKQALLNRYIRIETPGESYGFVSTTSLKPEPIPLKVKIILIGERWLYYLLSMYDHEFDELFNVAADLDDEIERSRENVQSYSQLVADRARTGELLPLSESGVRRVIEQAARNAGDSERLSMHIRSLDDLLIQSDHWARKRGSKVIERQDVASAISKREHRLDRSRNKVLEAIDRDVLLIETAGARVGQVNGLSIIDLGEFRYGHPMRITATTRMGTGDVVDIEREVELGGAIHSKGVLILSSALTSRYARETPLSIHASIVFEQSYGGVEGDSASVGELCALISSISGIPVLQNLAVTGSINQLGRVQVVGGINEKIEGFYDVCRSRGLDGTHGVVIPRDNIKHLMLREDVVEAVRDDKFAVYGVRDVDEAVTILTGVEADIVNAKVEDQLVRYATLRKEFSEKQEGDEQE
ncbi:MAG: AAA family ATPase [Woeseiaceae bacterium]|nr:AAA family ATPase [Woeseiaceae bacterium]NIP20141.1 AAA family ATPase [Woeseiaceae bacterium]NIS88937.1 AAA family ATPase [Woeseiaceae bacterium]